MWSFQRISFWLFVCCRSGQGLFRTKYLTFYMAKSKKANSPPRPLPRLQMIDIGTNCAFYLFYFFLRSFHHSPHRSRAREWLPNFNSSVDAFLSGSGHPNIKSKSLPVACVYSHRSKIWMTKRLKIVCQNSSKPRNWICARLNAFGVNNVFGWICVCVCARFKRQTQREELPPGRTFKSLERPSEISLRLTATAQFRYVAHTIFSSGHQLHIHTQIYTRLNILRCCVAVDLLADCCVMCLWILFVVPLLFLLLISVHIFNKHFEKIFFNRSSLHQIQKKNNHPQLVPQLAHSPNVFCLISCWNNTHWMSRQSFHIYFQTTPQHSFVRLFLVAYFVVLLIYIVCVWCRPFCF